MMKSMALNAVILYILFKSSVSDYLLSKLPGYLQGQKSFHHLLECLTNFALKGSRMSKRMLAILLFVVGLWLIKKIWQRLRGQHFLSQFVENYLCDNGRLSTMSPRMQEVDRKRFFVFP
jgi:hypothetical protein